MIKYRSVELSLYCRLIYVPADYLEVMELYYDIGSNSCMLLNSEMWLP